MKAMQTLSENFRLNLFGNKFLVAESIVLAKIALPLAFAQILNVGISLTNTYFIAKLGMDQLSGASLLIQCFTLFSAFINGLLSILGIQISYDKGKQDTAGSTQTLSDAFYLCLLLAIFFSVSLAFTPHLLILFNQPEESIIYAKEYIVPLLFATVPNVFWMAFRYFLCAEVRTSFIIWCNLFGFVVNLCGNYWLVNRWGLFGVAVSTALAYWAVLIVSLFYMHSTVCFRLYRPNWKRIGAFLRLGLPVSSSALCDTGFFTVIALLIGQFGATSLSCHHLALQFLIIPFVIPYSYSIATSLRIAFYEGKNEQTRLSSIAKIGTISALIPILVISIGYSGFPDLFLSTFQSVNQSEMAAKMIFLVGIMQILNTVQVVMMGALRGVKDTVIPFYISVCSYWVVGLPASLYCSYQWGPYGAWMGMIFAQTCLAFSLIRRWNEVGRRSIARKESMDVRSMSMK